jgi:hypothetical protein
MTRACRTTALAAFLRGADGSAGVGFDADASADARSATVGHGYEGLP